MGLHLSPNLEASAENWGPRLPLLGQEASTPVPQATPTEVRPQAPTLRPWAQRLLGGTCGIWHVPGSPPEWALGQDMGRFRVHGVI